MSGRILDRKPAATSVAAARGAALEPLLRVEVGAHTSTVTALAPLPGGEVLATASLDKTVRASARPRSSCARACARAASPLPAVRALVDGRRDGERGRAGSETASCG